MSNLGIINVVFPDIGFSFNTNNSNGNYGNNVYSLRLQRIIFGFYGALECKIALPLSLIMQSKLDLRIKAFERIICTIYPNITSLQNQQNGTLLMDGIVLLSDFTQTEKNLTLSIIAHDKTYLMQQQNMDSSINYDIMDMQTHILEVLRDNGLLSIIKQKNIIFPDSFALSALNDVILEKASTTLAAQVEKVELNANNLRQSGYQQSVYDYISTILNEKQILLTTVIQDNQTKLYFIDTGAIAAQYQQQSCSAIGKDMQSVSYNSNNNTQYPYVIEANVKDDFTKLYHKTHIWQQGLNENYDDTGSTNFQNLESVANSNKQQNFVFSNYLNSRNIELQNLSLLFSTYLNSTINASDLQAYALWRIKQEISQRVNISFKVTGHYCFNPLVYPKSPTWFLGAPIKLDSDILPKISQMYDQTINSKYGNKMILTGFTINYSESDFSTDLDILPSHLLDVQNRKLA